jgi:hypothetical protein
VFSRLSAGLYPQEQEQCVTLAANCFVSGLWASLPAIVLYLVLQGLSGRPERPSVVEIEELSGLPP